jgi:hypothetical protein
MLLSHFYIPYFCAVKYSQTSVHCTDLYFFTCRRSRCTVGREFRSRVIHIKNLSILGKDKVHLRTGHEDPDWEYRYGSTLSLTSVIDENGWSTPRSVGFTSGKGTRHPFYRRLGGPQGQSGRARNISPPPGFDPRTVQTVASRCANWAIPAHPSCAVVGN